MAAADEGERTPLGVEPGAPAGGYTLSEFERINLFNGSLSFYLPLLSVGGRGEAGFVVGLTVEKRWGVRYTREPTPRALPRFSWGGLRPGYGPGTFRFFRDVQEPYWLTRASFTASDETQYELCDVLFEGEPGPRASSRGQVFRTFDGSAISYVSDNPIVEDGTINQGSGRLLFPDGVEYRIDGGLVASIRDRNGNLVRFAYTTPPDFLPRGPQVSEIADSLERRVTFTYASDSEPRDTVAFKGFEGATRTITVDYADLGSALLEGESVRTLAQLFPDILWAVPGEVHNPKVVSSVTLPNGRQFVLSYNAYGEIAEVVLPTGGSYRYAHDGGTTGGGAPERRLRERSVYSAGGNHETRTVFSRPLDPTGPPVDQYVEVDSLSPATGALLARERHFYRGRSASDLVPGALSYPVWDLGKEYRTEIYGPGSPEPVLLRTTEPIWQQRAPRAWVQGGAGIANDPRIIQTSTTLENGLTSAEVYAYDLYNNRTDTWEYDLGAGGPGALLRRRHTDHLTVNNGVDYATSLSIHLRRLPLQQTTYDRFGQLRARTTYEYDAGALVDRSNLSGRVTPEGHGVGYTTRGNVTGVGRWLNSTGADLFTRRAYDIAGNVVSETDARQLTTSFSYGDNFGPPDGRISDHSPPAELGGFSTFAFASQTQNPLQHTTQTQTDYYVGRPVDAMDANGVVASLWFNDPLDRLSRIIQAFSPGHESARTRKAFAYDDDARTLTTVSDKVGFNDQQYKAEVVYDSLGREVARRTYEGQGSQSFIAVAKGYDARGRLSAVSNPYRSSETPIWTGTTFDALGRQTVQTLPDGTQVVTSYNGNAVTVTDQAGKVRKSVSDALGRVVSLVEDPAESGGTLNYQTSYTYSALDDLETVTQGPQTRTFAFDSLSRMTSQTTPEAGTTTYEYDANDNLLKRTDSRGVVTCWGTLGGTCTSGYDALDRPTRKSYSDGTPTVTYTYDSAAVPSAKGRLVTVSNSLSATNIVAYDPLGRVLSSTQTTGGSTYAVGYGYDRSGLLKEQAYPSGRLVYTARDLAGRVSEVSEQGQLYASSFQYFPHGAPSVLRLGNARWETSAFNERLQPRYLGLGTSAAARDLLQIENRYVDAPPAPNRNNGNVLKQVISMPGAAFTQDFTYDPANRLKTAAEGAAWSQTYTYDRFGNRATTGTRPNPEHTPTQLGHFSANNRINTTFDADIDYDTGGNLRRDAQARTLTYDAENRQTSVGTTTYGYDGEGRRVRKTVGSVTTTYVYDALGKLMGEYGPAPIPQPFYVTQDHLGSTRLATDAAGNVVGRWDYLPFGEEIPTTYGNRGGIPGYGSDPGVRQKYTGKERDSETSLDYFEARYDSAAQGRFQSADPETNAEASVADPQRWNRYAYVMNRPVVTVDPNGRDPFFRWVFGEEYVRRYGDRSTWEILFSKETLAEPAARLREDPYHSAQLTAATAFFTGPLGWMRDVGQAIQRFSRFGDNLPRDVPSVYRGGASLDVRAQDVKIDPQTGLVRTSHGPSLDADPGELAKFGGAFRIERIPKELTIVQRGRRPGHFEIVPKKPMTLKEFQELLRRVVLSKNPVQPK